MDDAFLLVPEVAAMVVFTLALEVLVVEPGQSLYASEMLEMKQVRWRLGENLRIGHALAVMEQSLCDDVRSGTERNRLYALGREQDFFTVPVIVARPHLYLVVNLPAGRGVNVAEHLESVRLNDWKVLSIVSRQGLKCAVWEINNLIRIDHHNPIGFRPVPSGVLDLLVEPVVELAFAIPLADRCAESLSDDFRPILATQVVNHHPLAKSQVVAHRISDDLRLVVTQYVGFTFHVLDSLG